MTTRPLVLRSVEDDHAERCVDIFRRVDGTFGFEEFRRDSEDMGRWTMTGSYSAQTFQSRLEAETKALSSVKWLKAEQLT